MISLTRRAMTASSVALLAGCATRTAATPIATAAPAAIGAFGIDLTARDLSVKPGDDFNRYANGTWLANTEIPADRSGWGSLYILDDKADRDVKAILDELSAGGGVLGANARKIADFYNAYLDVPGINAKGLAPASEDLAAIAAARTHEDLIRLIGRPDLPVASPIAIYVTLDERNPDRYVAGMSHAGLGLPEREYYLKPEEEFATIRTQYRDHMGRLLELGGQTGGAAKADAILAFETQIAERHWPQEQRRERDLTYNLLDRAQISAFAPNFPWDALFESAEMGEVNEVVITELSAMGPLADLFVATPVSTIKAYLTYHYLSNTANLLPTPLDDENFDFYNRTLNGQPQQRERWRRGVDAVNGALGEAIGEIYVQRHFPPAAKQQMLDLVENMRRAYGERIDGLTWMSAETKIVAREKLATFLPKIGYPDRWRDYSDLDIVAGDAFGNAKRSTLVDWRRDIARLQRPTDKTEWLYITPQVVNAYYNPVFNEVVFPAAILQPPFFDPNADPAVNYGGIGGVIGHEMGHGFDDQGAKSDAHGVLRDWWTPADVAAFQTRTDSLAAQYDTFEALPGLTLNGRNTLGENIGDLGGLQVALHAYMLSLGGAPAPVIDGTTGAQRFFLSWSQIWRSTYREQLLRNLVLSDVHSPPAFRINGTVRNMDDWYTAFNVQPGDALYLAPDQRVKIW